LKKVSEDLYRQGYLLEIDDAYYQPAAVFVFRLGREEGKRSSEDVRMNNDC